MRVKRLKKNRRTVRFFTVCFGFRQPYKVLCDGTFLHHLVTNQIIPADTAISDLLGGPVKLFTTSNILLIEQPSDFQRQTTKSSERKRLAMTDAEKRLLDKQTARILASNKEEGTSEYEQWETTRVVSKRDGLDVKDRPQFKRKRAKGPNPLSCIKKKKNNSEKHRSESKPSIQKEKKEGESSSKKRARKRSKHGRSGPETTE